MLTDFLRDSIMEFILINHKSVAKKKTHTTCCTVSLWDGFNFSVWVPASPLASWWFDYFLLLLFWMVDAIKMSWKSFWEGPWNKKLRVVFQVVDPFLAGVYALKLYLHLMSCRNQWDYFCLNLKCMHKCCIWALNAHYIILALLDVFASWQHPVNCIWKPTLNTQF